MAVANDLDDEGMFAELPEGSSGPRPSTSSGVSGGSGLSLTPTTRPARATNLRAEDPKRKDLSKSCYEEMRQLRDRVTIITRSNSGYKCLLTLWIYVRFYLTAKSVKLRQYLRIMN